MTKLFCIIERSCRMRREDIKECKNILYEKGWSITNNHKIADLILFFACDYAKTKERQMISEISDIKKELKSSAEFIVGGCLPKISKESLDKVFKGKNIGPGDYEALNNINVIKRKETWAIKVNDFFRIKLILCLKRFYEDCSSKLIFLRNLVKRFFWLIFKEGLVATFKRCLYTIKKFMTLNFNRCYTVYIVRGCINKCSYCAIRVATNPLKSKPLIKIIEEFKQGLNSGYRRFELLGDSVGDYGLDIGTNFGDLLKELLTIRKEYILRLRSLHPSSFLKYFNQIEALCKLNKIDSLYVPIQSANTRVLKLMNRHYDIEELKKRIFKIKEYKNVKFESGIMIGFPTEIEEEFEDTLNFIKDIKANYISIHLYSDMPNTESSKLSGKIDKDTVLKRYNRIKQWCMRYNVEDVEREAVYFRSL